MQTYTPSAENDFFEVGHKVRNIPMFCENDEVAFPPEEVYSSDLLTKKLNNWAAFHITQRQYDEALNLLTKALKLKKETIPDIPGTEKYPSNCNSCCTFEYCLAIDSQSCSSQHDYCCKQHQEQHAQDKHPRPAIEHANNLEDEDGYVCRQPLYVPDICIEECHSMGITLSLILIYNLALVHHLKALSMPAGNTARRSKILAKALHLYGLAYQLELDWIVPDDDDRIQGIGLLRFTMMLSNNIGEVHRLSGCVSEHKRCLEHLLTVIMYMVDSDNRCILNSNELDGLYRNVSTIMLTNVCAEAA